MQGELSGNVCAAHLKAIDADQEEVEPPKGISMLEARTRVMPCASFLHKPRASSFRILCATRAWRSEKIREGASEGCARLPSGMTVIESTDISCEASVRSRWWVEACRQEGVRENADFPKRYNGTFGTVGLRAPPHSRMHPPFHCIPSGSAVTYVTVL